MVDEFAQLLKKYENSVYGSRKAGLVNRFAILRS